MLLIGMKTSLITNPTTPMTANPRAQDPAIFKNSLYKLKLINNIY
jgi:hypothetical protein